MCVACMCVCLCIYMFVYDVHTYHTASLITLLHILKVIASNSLGVSDPVEVVGFTFPLPPTPILDEVGNITVVIRLNLVSTHHDLNISLEVSTILYSITFIVCNKRQWL